MRIDIANYKNSDNLFTFNNRKHIGNYDMKENHFHSDYELYYLMSGERYYFIKDRSYHVKKGDLVLINSNEVHKTYNAESPDHHRILVSFEEEYIGRVDPSAKDILSFLFLQSHPVNSLAIDEQIVVEDILSKISKEIEGKKIGYEMIIHSQVMELLVNCARYVENNQSPVIEHLSPVHEKMFEIVKYINENYAEPLTLPYISSHFYISPYYCSRIFKETTGFTFIEYLNSIRVQQAQRLLRETKLSVTDICERVGFGSIAHFGRRFKSITKKSPLNYRKSCHPIG